ncbi:MAG: GNAT family N-acetyltransferase [Coriobacteriia bacterium]
MDPTFTITTVERSDPAALADVRALLLQYRAWLGPLVGTTTLTEEIASLPEPYAPPGGALLLARDGTGQAAGCVGVRRHSECACEIKRLFVREDSRGHGLGRALARAGMDQARAMGYSEMYLITLPDVMDNAISMYRGLGFAETVAFRDFGRVPESVPMRFFKRSL